MSQEEIDKKCLDILVRYAEGKATRKEAAEVIQHHGDEIAAQVYNNGFALAAVLPPLCKKCGIALSERGKVGRITLYFGRCGFNLPYKRYGLQSSPYGCGRFMFAVTRKK